MGLEISMSFLLKILINSDLDLNVFVFLSIHSWKGIFFEPIIHPLFKPGLGSSALPSNRSRLLASTVWKDWFLIFSSICNLFFINSDFSFTEYFVVGFNL